MMFHPRFSQLNRFADGDLSSRARARVASHLAECARCRSVVQSIREISRQAPHLLEETAPSVIDDVLKRRAAGERIILPTADPQVPRSGDWRAASAVAAVLAFLLVTSLILVPRHSLRADLSELRFLPEQPERGSNIRVEYRASGLLAGEEKLVLRARFRTPQSRPYNRWSTQFDAAVLERTRKDVYGGVFTLPDSVVFAAFAIEDEAGQRVDSNNGRLWDLVTYRDGKPEYDGLVQRHHDLAGRDVQRMVTAMYEAYREYPDNPSALGAFGAALSFVRSMPAYDSLDAVFTQGFWDTHRKYATVDEVDGETLGWLYWSALRIDDDSLTRFWRSRLLGEATQSPLAVQERVYAAKLALQEDYEPLLREYENLWNEVGTTHLSVAQRGWIDAVEWGNDSAMAVWAPRHELVEPWVGETHAVSFLDHPNLRELGIDRLRSILTSIPETRDQRRNLSTTAEQQDRKDETKRRTILSHIGKALIAAGRVDAGIDTLEMAASGVWDPTAFRAIGDAHVELGDTNYALDMYARIAIDPFTDSATTDAVSTFALNVLDHSAWAERQSLAYEAMREHVQASAENLQLSQTLRLLDAEGEETTLWRVVNEQTTILLLWTWVCTWCDDELSGIARSLPSLVENGAAIASLLGKSEISKAQALFERYDLSIPTYVDCWDEVRVAAGAWGTPQYAVVDRSGRLRYSGFEVWEALRVAQILTNPQNSGGSAAIAPPN